LLHTTTAVFRVRIINHERIGSHTNGDLWGPVSPVNITKANPKAGAKSHAASQVVFPAVSACAPGQTYFNIYKYEVHISQNSIRGLGRRRN
jgi:hypothetical protein